jgi:hypothetical protein
MARLLPCWPHWVGMQHFPLGGEEWLQWGREEPGALPGKGRQGREGEDAARGEGRSELCHYSILNRDEQVFNLE